MMYDYIIVGAGPAGCVCAGELKRKNYSVCVLETQPFAGNQRRAGLYQ